MTYSIIIPCFPLLDPLIHRCVCMVLSQDCATLNHTMILDQYTPFYIVFHAVQSRSSIYQSWIHDCCIAVSILNYSYSMQPCSHRRLTWFGKALILEPRVRCFGPRQLLTREHTQKP